MNHSNSVILGHTGKQSDANDTTYVKHLVVDGMTRPGVYRSLDIAKPYKEATPGQTLWKKMTKNY